MKPITPIAVVLLALPMGGFSFECKLEGSREDWAKKLCLTQNGSLAKNEKALQECVKKEDEKVSIHSCEGNIIFKYRICEELIKKRDYKGSVEECLESEMEV